MTEQQMQDTNNANDETSATTDYVVLIAVEVYADQRDVVGWTGWREAGVLSVPQRTQRATVMQQAGEMATRGSTGSEPVRFRVYPLDAHSEGEAALTTPAPQLTVTTL